jgi:hypothetical protein
MGLEGERQIKILDFGLAKQEGPGDAQDSGEATATFAGHIQWKHVWLEARLARQWRSYLAGIDPGHRRLHVTGTGGGPDA